MDEVWKGAMRGVKSGYQMTKTALKNIPMDKLKVGGAVTSHRDIRRRFQQKYGGTAAPDAERRLGAEEEEGSHGESSSDEEPMTDEQIHEKVDNKFFDRDYNAMRYELTHMEATYATSEEEGKRERDAAEAKVSDLRAKCNLVSTTLKKRVLLHHNAFVSGIAEVRNINDSLLQTSSDCKKARTALRKSKAATASQVAILAQHRTKQNIESTLSLMGAMSRLCSKRDQLTALILSGRLVDAAELLKHQGAIDEEDKLARIYSMKPVLEQWRRYRDQPAQLTRCLDDVLTSCITVNFKPSTYRSAFESAPAFKKGDETCALVGQLLWSAAVQIVIKSLSEVSFVKSTDAPIPDIAEGIHPDHLLLCVCQLSVRLMDFIFLYTTILHLHEDESRVANSPVAALHGKAFASIRNVGHRIGLDLVQKLTLTLQSLRLGMVDVDHVLHLFVVASMLVEAITALGLDKAQSASARTQVKAVVERYMQEQFQTPKAKEVLAFMSQDLWTVSDVSAPSLNVVRPIGPDSYRKRIKEVKQYLSLAGSASSYMSNPDLENPFYSPTMVMPQDMSAAITTEQFSQYWMRMQDQGGSGAGETGADDGAAAPVSPTASTNADSTDPASLSAAAQSEMLAVRASMPPTILTSSALVVTNAFLEYQARVAVRYPPLATDILTWCEDLISTYIYTVADNFVSVSREVPVERQSDFSVQAQQTLTTMHTSADRAVAAVNGQFVPSRRFEGAAGAASTSGVQKARFPPRVWERIRNEFIGASTQYALNQRAVACECAMTLVFLHEASITTLRPLLPVAVVEAQLARCRTMYETAIEVLHVCLHRLCQAIFPMEAVCKDISKLKLKGDEVKVSPYVADIIAGLKDLNQRREALPTPMLETLFYQRLIFAVQSTLVREYSKLNKKKMSDIGVMQLQVDVQSFQQQVATVFGRENVVWPDHVLGLIKTGFFMDSTTQQMQWVRQNHQRYYTADLLSWFGGTDKAFKAQLEDVLLRELHHHDAVPVERFSQQVR